MPPSVTGASWDCRITPHVASMFMSPTCTGVLRGVVKHLEICMSPTSTCVLGGVVEHLEICMYPRITCTHSQFSTRIFHLRLQLTPPHPCLVRHSQPRPLRPRLLSHRLQLPLHLRSAGAPRNQPLLGCRRCRLLWRRRRTHRLR
jgi:hypothetical protein